MTRLSDITPKDGMGALDYHRYTPKRRIPRSQELGGFVDEVSLPRHHDELLCQGAALGKAGGIVTHLAPNQAGFAGFLIGNEDGDKARLYRRGRFFLQIEGGVTDRDRGRIVYSSPTPDGPYTLQHFEGAYAIGKVRFAESPTVASVAFRAYDATGPDDLDLSH